MYEVREGDMLWAISLDAYGDGTRYADILAANPGALTQLASPGLLRTECAAARTGLAEALSEAGSGLDAGQLLRLPPP